MDKCTNGGNGMNKEKREWLTSLRLVIIIITIAITVRTIFFSPIIVDGPSMLPTLESQDQMIINKFVYRMKEPERFDIVVFHASEEDDFIKRVIGLPGEHVAVDNGKLYVNDEEINEPYLDTANQPNFRLQDLPGSYDVIPENYLLVLGDNRTNSVDSRSFGLVKKKDIVGRASLIYWPLHRFQKVN